MSNIFVLHDTPRFAAPLMADIHLRPALLESCKLVSTAVSRMAPDRIQKERSPDGVIEYRYLLDKVQGKMEETIPIIPPYPGGNQWVGWACESYWNIWWLIEMAWWADKELQHRFYTEQSPHYLALSKLVEAGVTRYFPKPDVKMVGNWPNPPRVFDYSDDDILRHQKFYTDLKKQGKIRMKWTNREEPTWLGENKKLLCPECLAPKPTSEGCGITGCPFEVN